MKKRLIHFDEFWIEHYLIILSPPLLLIRETVGPQNDSYVIEEKYEKHNTLKYEFSFCILSFH